MMQSILFATTLSVLLAVCLGAVGNSSMSHGADVDPNTKVPRTYEEYKKFCKVITDPSKDAAQKATFLKTVAEVRANQQQQATGKKMGAGFVGMNLNCMAHMNEAERRKGLLGLSPATPVQRPGSIRGSAA